MNSRIRDPVVRPRTGTPLAAAAAVLFAVMLVGGFVAQVTIEGLILDDIAMLAGAITTTAVGLVITTKRPGHRVGWIVLLLGGALCLQVALGGFAAVDPSPGWLVTTVLWIDSRSFLTLWIGLIALFFNFPTGSLPPEPWRTVGRAAAGFIVFALIINAVAPGPLREGLPPSPTNPLNPIALPADLWARLRFLDTIGLLGVVAALLASLASLVSRYRRASVTQRLQIRWVVSAAVAFVAVLLVSVIVRHVSPELLYLADGVAGFAFLVLPLSVGVAVLRHNLYEIDRIINRTAVYTAVTVVLGAAYLGLVTAMRAATEDITGDSALAVAASTLAVAALFQPARRRIQHAVDRRFNRARYDAAATVASFSTRLRDEIDLDSLRTELLRVVASTMQPTDVRLWLRESLR